jgi:hypothetical protein
VIPLVLSDKSVVPTDDLIFSIIGINSKHWILLMRKMNEKFPDAVGEWNYYNDGKNWLFKMVRKKKTLFWIGIHSDTFSVTFYLGEKAESAISASKIPDDLKQQYLTGRRFGKIRAISIRVEDSTHIDHVLELCEIKSKF